MLGDGLEVVETEGGRAAIREIERRMPDVVLLDLRAEDRSALQVCEEIRKHPNGRNVPVLMVTEQEDVASILQAYDAGATDFVSRPINWLILAQRVRYMIRASRSLSELFESQERLRNAQRIARVGSCSVDLDAGEVTCSEEMQRIFGFHISDAPLPLSALLDRVHAEDRERLSNADTPRLSADFRIVVPAGRERTVHAELEPVRSDDGRVLLEGIVQDLTERRQVEEQIRYLAHYDGTTGLANRAFFGERLEEEIARSRRDGAPGALVLLSLDSLRTVNETLGSVTGDRMLQETADRLSDVVRSIEFSMENHSAADPRHVSRRGGNHFTILLPRVGQAQDAAAAARRLLAVFEQPFEFDGNEILASVSAGIAIFPADGNESEELLRNAEAAMRHARRSGGGGFHFYRPEMNAKASHRMQLEMHLRRAIDGEQLRLHYQPKLCLGTGEITGVEALLRWDSAELGSVSPTEFVPVAEEAGLMVAIGDWVIHTACRQHRSWRDAGLGSIRVATNIAPQQFADGSLLLSIEHALAEFEIDPEFLELEITEGSLMQDGQHAVNLLQQFRERGIHVALDDFGTGYSSLSYLKRFPVDKLKIDRAFIMDLPEDQEDATLTIAIISLAQALGLRVVAEGVETVEQRDFLAERGCDEIQGYWFSRPLTPEALADFLRSR